MILRITEVKILISYLFFIFKVQAFGLCFQNPDDLHSVLSLNVPKTLRREAAKANANVASANCNQKCACVIYL